MKSKLTSHLEGLKPALQTALDNGEEWHRFEHRLGRHFDLLYHSLQDLYGDRDDFSTCLESILLAAASAYRARPVILKSRDEGREQDASWYLGKEAVGGVCYVDLFADNLTGLEKRLPYFKELGINYLHLMPLFQAPEGRNDGGYAVSDYRRVNPALGNMKQLTELISLFRENGISIVLDFIYNHTSDEHEWAQRAKRGEREYQEFYYIYPNREIPDRYEENLREVFPEEKPGSFSYCEQLGQWVWTTFKSYQWDLNYGNPAVFKAMAEEMLYLANCGVDILRLDAVAFAWKEMGTACESLDKVHVLVTAFNQLAQIAAPSLLFKSEAIVHPDEVTRYINPRECQLSYNPLLMALLWEALATRDVKLLQHSMAKRFRIHADTSWINYIRSHDDVGWTFCDDDAAEVGINGHDHRQFLNRFYTGEFPGSFARGVPFQYSPETGDCRVCGSTASLAGLEKALNDEGEVEQALALSRILLLHSVLLSIGGIPLIYLGDEIATQNDYSYQDDRHKHNDSRWVHRHRFSSNDLESRNTTGTPANTLFARFKALIDLRKSTAALSGQDTDFIPSRNGQIFAYLRRHADKRLLALCNFSESSHSLALDIATGHFGDKPLTDLVNGETLHPGTQINFEPYQFRWLQPY